MTIETTSLGKTGLEVSKLGIGLVKVGHMSGVEDASRVLNTALDRGINFLDTAACYGNSEEMVGAAIGHRRDEYVLATKAGHVTRGATGEHWSPETVSESIDRSLKRMNTDHLDIVQLHSPDVDVLERGEAAEALVRAKEAGKTRFIGYSGDNEAARWAIDSGLFDTLQTSLNIVDQSARTRLLGPAEARGMGIIIKRPIGNAVWGTPSRPSDSPSDYFARAQEMAGMGPLPDDPEDPALLALGFIFAHPEVDTAIVGTGNLSHLTSNIEMVERDLPISTAAVEELHRRFDELGDGWHAMM